MTAREDYPAFTNYAPAEPGETTGWGRLILAAFVAGIVIPALVWAVVG